jgi:tRNA-splicing ligase RtcB
LRRVRCNLLEFFRGNHFLEIQKVDQIFDEKTAKTFGVTSSDQIIIMLHCGSRGFGHQVATDYLELHEKDFYLELHEKDFICMNPARKRWIRPTGNTTCASR